MAHPRGESGSDAVRLDFDRRLMLHFRGSVVTSDAGLLAYRELDDVLGLTEIAGDVLADARSGKNGRHALAGLFRQSVFGRLAGYEDVNGAERRRHDPAMRWIVGGKAAQGRAASPSQMGRFETQWLAAPENLSAIADLSGQWIDLVHGRRPPRSIVLDMDSSVSPTHGEQEMSLWNGHYACTCYHPLFVFNQFGDLERWPCVPATCTAPTAGTACSRLSLHAIRASSRVSISALTQRSPCRRSTSSWKPSGSNMRSACRNQPDPPGQDRLSAQTSGRTTRAPCAPVSCELQLSGRKLEQAAPGDCQGRVASRRTLSARRLHRDEHEPPGRACGRILQQARHVRAMDQGRQGRDQMDAAVVPDVRGQRRAAPTSCARLQPRQFPAHAGDARADQGLVTDKLEGEADQDWRESREPRPLCRLPDGRGRHPAANVPGDFAAHRGTAAAATTSASVRRSMVVRSRPTNRRSASLCQGKSPETRASSRVSISALTQRSLCRRSTSSWKPRGSNMRSACRPTGSS